MTKVADGSTAAAAKAATTVAAATIEAAATEATTRATGLEAAARVIDCVGGAGRGRQWLGGGNKGGGLREEGRGASAHEIHLACAC